MWIQLPPEKRHTHPYPIFGPCLLWPDGWMDEDAAWYGSRPRPRPHCTGHGHSSRERDTAAPLFLAHVYCGHGRPAQLLLSSFLFWYTVVDVEWQLWPWPWPDLGLCWKSLALSSEVLALALWLVALLTSLILLTSKHKTFSGKHNYLDIISELQVNGNDSSDY